MRATFFLCTALFVVLSAGCSSRVCEPGAFDECDCPAEHIEGVKECDARGTSWGACKCVLPPERWPAEKIPTGDDIERLRRELQGGTGQEKAPAPAPPQAR